MSCEADAVFHRLCQRFLDADKKDKWRCCFCKCERAYNLTKFKRHLCGSGRSACLGMRKPLKALVFSIYGLQTDIRSGQDKHAELFKAVGEANELLRINRLGIPRGGLNDADPLADEDTGGVMPVYVGDRIPTCPVPTAEGTRGEQIAATDGPIFVAEIDESSKGRANTLPKVDVSSPLNPFQEHAEKDPIILNLVKIEARVAAQEQEIAGLKAEVTALKQDNVDLKAEVTELKWQNANINKPNLENAELNLPNFEISDFNIEDIEDWGNAVLPNIDDH